MQRTLAPPSHSCEVISWTIVGFIWRLDKIHEVWPPIFFSFWTEGHFGAKTQKICKVVAFKHLLSCRPKKLEPIIDRLKMLIFEAKMWRKNLIKTVRFRDGNLKKKTRTRARKRSSQKESFFFFSWTLSWSRAFFLSFFLFFLIAFLVEFLFSCYLTFLFSFINSQLSLFEVYIKCMVTCMPTDSTMSFGQKL